MRKNFFLLSSFALLSANFLFAQSETSLIPLSTHERIWNEMEVNKPQGAGINTGMKPTIAKQRLVASSIYRDGTLNDTARYFFSSIRGSYGASQKGAFEMVSNFDTAYAFDIGNSLNPILRSTQFYNTDNYRTSFYNYRADGTMSSQGWTEYHPNNGFSRNGSIYLFPMDTIYRDATYRDDGKFLTDTSNQIVHSISTPGYNYSTKRRYEYDAQGRKTFVSYALDAHEPGGSNSLNTIWYFYDNNNQQQPTKDSSVLVFTQPNSSSSFSKSTYTYDAAGRLLEKVIYLEPSHQLDQKIKYTYNPSGKVLNIIYENYSGGQPNIYYKYEYNYSNDVLISDVNSNKVLPATTWTESHKILYHLNADLLADSVTEFNNGAIHQIKTYSYNDFKNIVDQKISLFNDLSLTSESVTHNYYEIYEGGPDATGLNNISSKTLDVQMFPNPTSDKVQIIISKLRGNAQINICNLSGAVLDSQTTVAERTMIDVGMYAKGIYLVKSLQKKVHLLVKL